MTRWRTRSRMDTLAQWALAGVGVALLAHVAVWLRSALSARGCPDAHSEQEDPMATVCPSCEHTVRPVITRDRSKSEDDPDWLDADRGLHCPDCGYRFADVDEVYTGGYR